MVRPSHHALTLAAAPLPTPIRHLKSVKILFDFFPIALFFVAYKLYDIYVATAVAIAATFVQVGAFWLRHRRFERMHLITLALITVLGGATLIFHNPTFIKWKPTVINGLFALAFLVSQYVGKAPLIRRMMGSAIELPDALWKRLNLAWVGFFIFSAVANLYVAYRYDEATWVNFKLFGLLGLTLIFILAQGVWLARAAPRAPGAE